MPHRYEPKRTALINNHYLCYYPISSSSNGNRTEWIAIQEVIITISKFSNLIGHQQA